MRDAIDWDAAARRSGALAKAGPATDVVGAQGLIASLRDSAQRSPAYVAEVTGLAAAAERTEHGTVLVVDRPRWSRAAVQTFQAMAAGQLPAPRLPGAARAAGEQLGWVLALLSTRILGQFDPYVAAVALGRPPGRLLLVAPNILGVQRQLDADSADFHLWVCLHEQTHAVQFAAAPWLAAYLQEAMLQTLRTPGEDAPADDTPAQPSAGAEPGSAGRPRTEPPGRDPASSGALPGILEMVLPPDQVAVLERAVAVMSLLEGHADVVMDEVGPRVIPSVEAIRAGFERRRERRGLVTLVLRRLLGMDAKLAQYRNGAAFVRGVLAEVGHDGLNAVWTGPQYLPEPEEIADPHAWVRRVHG